MPAQRYNDVMTGALNTLSGLGGETAAAYARYGQKRKPGTLEKVAPIVGLVSALLAANTDPGNRGAQSVLGALTGLGMGYPQAVQDRYDFDRTERLKSSIAGIKAQSGFADKMADIMGTMQDDVTAERNADLSEQRNQISLDNLAMRIKEHEAKLRDINEPPDLVGDMSEEYGDRMKTWLANNKTWTTTPGNYVTDYITGDKTVTNPYATPPPKPLQVLERGLARMGSLGDQFEEFRSPNAADSITSAFLRANGLDPDEVFETSGAGQPSLGQQAVHKTATRANIAPSQRQFSEPTGEANIDAELRNYVTDWDTITAEQREILRQMYRNGEL